jgi:hypothetical protein
MEEALGLSRVVERQDVGVLEVGGDLHFAEEPLDPVAVSQCRGQAFKPVKRLLHELLSGRQMATLKHHPPCLVWWRPQVVEQRPLLG